MRELLRELAQVALLGVDSVLEGPAARQRPGLDGDLLRGRPQRHDPLREALAEVLEGVADDEEASAPLAAERRPERRRRRRVAEVAPLPREEGVEALH